MPLQIRISGVESADSTQLNISDVTGIYDATTDPQGYGGINPDVADMLTAVLSVTKPDPTTFLPSSDPTMTIDVDVYYGNGGYLPNTTGVTQPILAVDDLGYEEKLQNGIYKIVLTCTDVDTTYISDDYYILVYNQLVCCVTRPYLTFNLDECGSCLQKDSAAWNIMLGNFYKDGAYWAWYYELLDGTGDFSKCAEYLEALTNICNECGGCQTC